jgi:hypothetical protein
MAIRLRQKRKLHGPSEGLGEGTPPGTILAEGLQARDTTEVALDPEEALGISAGSWVNLQAHYALAQVRPARAGSAGIA